MSKEGGPSIGGPGKEQENFEEFVCPALANLRKPFITMGVTQYPIGPYGQIVRFVMSNRSGKTPRLSCTRCPLKDILDAVASGQIPPDDTGSQIFNCHAAGNPHLVAIGVDNTQSIS